MILETPLPLRKADFPLLSNTYSGEQLNTFLIVDKSHLEDYDAWLRAENDGRRTFRLEYARMLKPLYEIDESSFPLVIQFRDGYIEHRDRHNLRYVCEGMMSTKAEYDKLQLWALRAMNSRIPIQEWVEALEWARADRC